MPVTAVRRRLPLVAGALAALVVASCGGSADVDDATLLANSEATATAPAAPATASPAPEPSATPAQPGIEFEIDASLIRPKPTPVAPSGEPPAPPPTPAAGSGSRWKYRALLGSLGPDDVVVPPVAAPVEAAPGTAPLTGLIDDSTLARAVVIKIDNTNAARPQVGINRADIVYEEMVEVGITRLAAVFHSQGADTVGPVRSGRSTDIAIIGSFGEPVFSNSGANSIFDGLLAAQPIVNRGAEQYGGYWRSSGRPAPHNLFTGTATLLDGVSASPPPAHFAYRADGAELPADARPASTVTIVYSAGSYSVAYEWDASVGGWARRQSGSAHVDATGVQVAPENLIVQFVDYVDTGMSDKFDTVIVEGEAIGTGGALVFTDGHAIDAVWTKSTLRTPTTFTDAEGNHIELTPGRTWVALVPPGGASWTQ